MTDPPAASIASVGDSSGGPAFVDLAFDASAAPSPDSTAEPAGFVVETDDGTRIHFLDWGGPTDGVRVLLLHGLAQTAWIWAPVARRLRNVARVVAVDLRGHGLSDAPTEGYDPDALAADVVAAAEGSGLLGADRDEATSGATADAPVGPLGPLVIAGHGFGAIVGAWMAAALGDRVAGLVLVDGGWEDVGAVTGLEPDEFRRGLDEPPEVLRTMEAFLADRREFDPATWDADEEHAARATVVETHAKRLTPATRPHALRGAVDAMFAYDPAVILPSVEARIVILTAADDEFGTHALTLSESAARLRRAGRPPLHVARFPDAGHNLMRYRPAAVAAAILAAAGTLRP